MMNLFHCQKMNLFHYKKRPPDHNALFKQNTTSSLRNGSEQQKHEVYLIRRSPGNTFCRIVKVSNQPRNCSRTIPVFIGPSCALSIYHLRKTPSLMNQRPVATILSFFLTI